MSNAVPKTTFVLVSDAWHTPWHYELVTQSLRDAGHTVIVPRLPSISVVRDPGNALGLDTNVIVDTITDLTSDGHDVVLVMHGYGSVPGSEAAAIVCEKQVADVSSQKIGRIHKLVYVAGYLLTNGESIAGQYPSQISPATSFRLRMSSGKVIMPVDSPARIFNNTNPTLAFEAEDHLAAMALSAFTSRTEYCGWRDYDLPMVYVGCKLDLVFPAYLQQQLVARLSIYGIHDAQILWLESDRSPFLSVPEKAAPILLAAAAIAWASTTSVDDRSR